MISNGTFNGTFADAFPGARAGTPSGAGTSPSTGRNVATVAPGPQPKQESHQPGTDPDPTLRPATVISLDLRSTLWVTGAVLAAAVVFAVFRNAGSALVQLSMGVILALALDPLVVATGRRLRRTRTQSVVIVTGSFVVIGMMVLLFVGPPAAKQASQFGKELPSTLHEFENLPLVGGPLRHYDLSKNVNEWIDQLPNRFDATSVQNTTARLLSNVVSFVVVGCVVIGALLDGPRLLALIRSMFRRRPKRLARIDRIGQIMAVTLGQYFGGSLTVAAMMGLFVLIVGLVLAIPLAVLAALWAMFTDLIPQVGGLLGGGFLVMLALTKGPVTAIVAGGLFLVYMNLENHLITPAIVGESVGLTPATTMLAAFIGGAIAGLPGTLVATPVVGAAKRLYFEFRTGRPMENKPHVSAVTRLRIALSRRHRKTHDR